MKQITEMFVGNTAMQIVEKGNHIRVINIEQHKQRRFVIRNTLLVMVLSIMLVGISYSIIKNTNENVMLGREIAALNTEISQLEKENSDFRNNQYVTVDYDKLMKEAKGKYGMDFPKKKQVLSYQVEK